MIMKQALGLTALSFVYMLGCGDDAGDDVDSDGGRDDASMVDEGDAGEDSGPGGNDGGAEGLVLSGLLRGPTGATVTLRFGDEELEVEVLRANANSDDYDATAFSFETRGRAGDDYEVTIAQQPDDFVCEVYKGASGMLPVGEMGLLVGCERNFDHVSRSSDDEVLGTFFESTDISIGGADEAVGRTAEGYGEGRFVVFVSSAVDLEGSDGASRQIFWRDRLSGQTTLVSKTSDGEPGDDDSFAPAISADGLHVVFESYASNLVADDTNEVRDVFFWDATSPEAVERLSVGPGDEEADAESFAPTVSGDGSIVAFSTGASNLTDGVEGTSTINVVRRDRLTGTNTLISADIAGEGVGGDRPMLSEDGNRLVFWSFAADITDGDANGLWDIFVYEHDSETRRRVSLTGGDGERNQGDESTSRVVTPTISGDGRFVAYATTSSNVVEGDTNGAQDIFVVDLDGDEGVRRVSVGEDEEEGDGDSPTGQGERVALSRDGGSVAFSSQASNFGAGEGNIFLRNLETGELRAVTDLTSGVGSPSLSRTGAYLALGAGDDLDARFSSSGLFVHYTGIDRSFWWIE